MDSIRFSFILTSDRHSPHPDTRRISDAAVESIQVIAAAPVTPSSDTAIGVLPFVAMETDKPMSVTGTVVPEVRSAEG